MSKEKVTEICTRLLAMFASGELPPAVARTVIARCAGDDKPCNKWSFCNQLLMIIGGTEDARGFRQWQEVKRSVSKGSKAIYILAPLTAKATKTVIDQVTHCEVQEEFRMIRGFKAVPVFRLEDTDGDPLPAYNYEPPLLPPLFEVAEHFGMVKYYPHIHSELGSCSTNGNITLYTADADVFFHELGHQIHNTIKPLKGGQHTDQELIAEMVSCVLCQMYDIQGYLWQGWEYMKAYVNKEPSKTLKAIIGVLNEVEAIVGKILAVKEQINIQADTVA